MDLFDTKNISDLPKELVDELLLLSETDKKVLTLFSRQNVLNHNQIMVGWFRLYKEVKPRMYFTTTLYRMQKKGLLHSTKNKGEYTLSEFAKELLK
jgi:hypothetical protein